MTISGPGRDRPLGDRDRPVRREPQEMLPARNAVPGRRKPPPTATPVRPGGPWAVPEPEVASGQDLADQSRSHQEPPRPPARWRPGACGRVTSEETQASSEDEQRVCVGRATAMGAGGRHSQDSQSGQVLGLGTVPRGPPRNVVPRTWSPPAAWPFPPRVFAPILQGSVQNTGLGTWVHPRGHAQGTHPAHPRWVLVHRRVSQSLPPSHPTMPLSYKMAESAGAGGMGAGAWTLRAVRADGTHGAVCARQELPAAGLGHGQPLPWPAPAAPPPGCRLCQGGVQSPSCVGASGTHQPLPLAAAKRARAALGGGGVRVAAGPGRVPAPGAGRGGAGIMVTSLPHFSNLDAHCRRNEGLGGMKRGGQRFPPHPASWGSPAQAAPRESKSRGRENRAAVPPRAAGPLFGAAAVGRGGSC